MAWLDIVATASTVLFRVAVYLYLRVLPARFAKFILPPLFVISTAANVLVQKQLPRAETQTTHPLLADVDVDVKTETPAPPTAASAKPDIKPRTSHAPQQPSSSVFKTALQRVFDLLSGTNVRKSGLNVLGNTLLFLAAVDFTAHPFIYQYEDVVFARVGAVTHNSAKIQARYPGLETNSSRIRYRSAAGSAAWKDGPLLTFDDSHDFVAVGKLTGLYPSTHYEYILAYPNATQLPYPAAPLQFRTFPDTSLTSASGTHFKFLVSSCAMPNFPYMPFSGTRVKGFDYLATFLGSNGFESRTAATHREQAEPVEEAAPTVDIDDISPESDATSTTPSMTTLVTPTTPVSDTSAPFIPTEFMLFLGDFIYADVPWGVQTLSHYRSLYRRMFASPSVRKVYERLPIFTIYDDHEFVNNFAGNSNQTKEPWTNASTAYHDYLGAANHDIRGGHSYYEFRYGDSAFFVLDTRKHRSDETVDPEERTILGDAQLAALHNWLARVNGTAVWKFVVSSVPLSTLWAYDAKEDSWAAFDKERQSVLSALTTVDNVVVLTGDRHQYAVIDFFGGRLLEISTSPLSQFDLAIKGIPALGRWASEETFNRTVVVLNATDGSEYQATVQTPVERVLEYIPKGNYKVSSIEVDTTDRDAPKLVAELIVSGKSVWRIAVAGKPVRLSATQALGRQLTQSFKDILGLVRLSPGNWF